MKKLLLLLILCLALAVPSYASVSISTTKVIFAGSGSTGPYAFSFPIYASTDLLVIKYDASGNGTTLALNTDYTVSLASGAGSHTGSVTLTSTLAYGYTLVIMRSMPYLQSQSWTNLGQFTAQSINDGLDKLDLQIQQLYEMISRSLIFPPYMSGPYVLAPSASSLIGWNSLGTGLTNYNTSYMVPLAVPQIDFTGNYGNSLNTAIAAIGTNTRLLMVKGAVTLTASLTVPANIQLWIPADAMINLAGYTLTINGPFQAGPYQVFSGTGTVKFGAGATHAVYPEWWATNTTPGTTDMTAAVLAAEASLPGDNTYGGGTIEFGPTTYSITNWPTSRINMVVRGHGQFTTTLLGSGAGAAVVTLTTYGRQSWSDLSIDGNDIKTAAVITSGSWSNNVMTNARMLGGTRTTFNLGETAGGPDVSDNTFVSCTIQSNNATMGQLTVRGNNTSGNHFVGGRISTGSSTSGNAVDVDDGAETNFFGTNLLGLPTDYAIKANSGVVRLYGCHCEAGGLILTVATDGRRDTSTPPHLISNVSAGASGVSGMVIDHQAARTLIIEGGLYGSLAINTGTGATLITSGLSGSYTLTGTGTVYSTKSGAKSALAGYAGAIDADAVHVRTNGIASYTGRSPDAGNTTPQPLIGMDANGLVVIGGQTNTIDAGLQVRFPYTSAATLPVGSASMNGCIAVDGTNNRLVYYSGGLRYFIPIGTVF